MVATRLQIDEGVDPRFRAWLFLLLLGRRTESDVYFADLWRPSRDSPLRPRRALVSIVGPIRFHGLSRNDFCVLLFEGHRILNLSCLDTRAARRLGNASAKCVRSAYLALDVDRCPKTVRPPQLG